MVEVHLAQDLPHWIHQLHMACIFYSSRMLPCDQAHPKSSMIKQITSIIPPTMFSNTHKHTCSPEDVPEQLHGDRAHITSSDQCAETHDAEKLIPGHMVTFQILKCA